MIGKKIVINGDTLYHPEYVDDGCTFGTLFKDEDAFTNNSDDICYIPEAYFDGEADAVIDGEEYFCVNGYTRKDLEELVEGEIDNDGDPIDVEYFFQSLMWCCPDTRLNEITY